MARISLVFGIASFAIFFIAILASRALVLSEQEWNIGVALALCAGAAIALGAIGAGCSLVALYRTASKRMLALVALTLNLTPLSLYLLSRLAGGL